MVASQLTPCTKRMKEVVWSAKAYFDEDFLRAEVLPGLFCCVFHVASV